MRAEKGRCSSVCSIHVVQRVAYKSVADSPAAMKLAKDRNALGFLTSHGAIANTGWPRFQSSHFPQSRTAVYSKHFTGSNLKHLGWRS